MTKRLKVYLHQHHVGGLTQDDSGEMSFAYTEKWLNHPQTMALSQSLPLQPEPFDRSRCRGFFSGVLPDEQKRKIMARILGISARNDFSLLEKIGGECAGAVTFLPDGMPFKQADYKYRTLDLAELSRVLRALPRQPLMVGDRGVRLSLAGAQDKVAVMVRNNTIFIPLGSAPSTHIIKPAVAAFAGLVYNESFCLELASRVGLPAVKTTVHYVDGIDYLLVERYDRLQTKKIQRLHQEDFCQALGIGAELKYQNEGGPSLKQCFALVRAVSSVPVLDLKKLLDAVIFNLLIGNHDAHGKNFSLLYTPHGVELAPLYDVVCTAYYPELSQSMAMKIGKQGKSDRVRPVQFESLAKEIGFAAPIVLRRVHELAHEIIFAADDLEKKDPVSHDVAALIRNRCTRFEKMFGESI